MGSLPKHRIGSVVTRSGELLDEFPDVIGFGGASSDHPYPELTEEEAERDRAARRLALERKRPAGFAPWGDA